MKNLPKGDKLLATPKENVQEVKESCFWIENNNGEKIQLIDGWVGLSFLHEGKQKNIVVQSSAIQDAILNHLYYMFPNTFAKASWQPIIKQLIQDGAIVITDKLHSYSGLSADYVRGFVTFCSVAVAAISLRVQWLSFQHELQQENKLREELRQYQVPPIPPISENKLDSLINEVQDSLKPNEQILSSYAGYSCNKMFITLVG